MSAVGEELTGGAFDRGIEIYNGRFPNPDNHGVRLVKPEDLRSLAPYRLYRATASEHWVLDPASSPDSRVTVEL